MVASVTAKRRWLIELDRCWWFLGLTVFLVGWGLIFWLIFGWVFPQTAYRQETLLLSRAGHQVVAALPEGESVNLVLVDDTTFQEMLVYRQMFLALDFSADGIVLKRAMVVGRPGPRRLPTSFSMHKRSDTTPQISITPRACG